MGLVRAARREREGVGTEVAETGQERLVEAGVEADLVVARASEAGREPVQGMDRVADSEVGGDLGSEASQRTKRLSRS